MSQSECKQRYKERIRAIPLELREIPARQKCKRCGRTKAIKQFGVSLVSKTGRNLRCIKCTREIDREKYASSSEQRAQQKKASDKYRRSEEGQLAELNSTFRRKYGITVEDYFAMLARQNGLCALCFNPPTNNRRLSVDHDHATGEVRGLLCVRCNNGLERFDSVLDFASRVDAYLKSPIFRQMKIESGCIESEAIS